MPGDFNVDWGDLGRYVDERMVLALKAMRDFQNLPEAEKEAITDRVRLERREKDRQEDDARDAMLAVLARHPDVIEALQRYHSFRDMYCEDCCLSDVLGPF